MKTKWPMQKILLAFSLLSSYALQGQLVKNQLDLHNNGQFVEIELPFQYYHRTNEPCSIIHQGGYKVFDLINDTNHLIIIGTLQPCIGVVVTDGTKLIAFHKHWSNNLDSMKTIIEGNLDISDAQNLRARIYTVRNDVVWNQHHISLFHNNKTHTEEIKRIKDFLCTSFAIPRSNIIAQLHNLYTQSGAMRYPDYYLGQYEYAELCVAVHLGNDTFDAAGNIRLYSIDFCQADFYNLKQLNPHIAHQTENGSLTTTRYNELAIGDQQTVQKHHLQEHENRLYKGYFDKDCGQLCDGYYLTNQIAPFNTFDFYPID